MTRAWVKVTLCYPVDVGDDYLEVQTADPSPDAAGMTYGTWHRTHGTWCAGNLIEELETMERDGPEMDPSVGCLCDVTIRPVTVTREKPPVEAEYVYVDEGWWHPDVKSGQVHLHPEKPGGGWSVTMHRQCEPVYTRRKR